MGVYGTYLRVPSKLSRIAVDVDWDMEDYQTSGYYHKIVVKEIISPEITPATPPYPPGPVPPNLYCYAAYGVVPGYEATAFTPFKTVAMAPLTDGYGGTRRTMNPVFYNKACDYYYSVDWYGSPYKTYVAKRKDSDDSVIYQVEIPTTDIPWQGMYCTDNWSPSGHNYLMLHNQNYMSAYREDTGAFVKRYSMTTDFWTHDWQGTYSAGTYYKDRTYANVVYPLLLAVHGGDDNGARIVHYMDQSNGYLCRQVNFNFGFGPAQIPEAVTNPFVDRMRRADWWDDDPYWCTIPYPGAGNLVPDAYPFAFAGYSSCYCGDWCDGQYGTYPVNGHPQVPTRASPRGIFGGNYGGLGATVWTYNKMFERYPNPLAPDNTLYDLWRVLIDDVDDSRTGGYGNCQDFSFCLGSAPYWGPLGDSIDPIFAGVDYGTADSHLYNNLIARSPNMDGNVYIYRVMDTETL